MDEPIAHLDAKLRHHMRGELKKLQKQIEDLLRFNTALIEDKVIERSSTDLAQLVRQSAEDQKMVLKEIAEILRYGGNLTFLR